MALSNAPKVLLPLYQRAPVAPSIARRAGFMTLQLAVAALYGAAAVILPVDMFLIPIVPIAIGLLIVLWLMPNRGVFPLRPIERVYGVTLFLMLAWPNYIAIVLPGLPWVTPTRVALFILTFLFLYSISTSSPLRSHIVTVARSSPLLWALFLLWNFTLFLSLPFSDAIGSSVKGLIDDQLRLTQMFFIGCLIFARRGGPTWTVRWLLILSLVSALDGFLELRLGYPPWAHNIPSFMKIDNDLLEEILSSQARSDDGFYRVRGPYVNSLVFAEFLAICTPFIIHWLLTGRSLKLRVGMACLWVVILGAIIVTQSRLGLIGTIVAIGCYVPLWAYRQWRSDQTSIIGPSLLFGAPIVAMALIGMIFSSHTLTMRVLGGGAQAASDDARVQQKQMAIPKIETHPLGHGINQAAGVLGFTSPNGRLTVDNYYLNTLLDLGFPGAIGFYGMFLLAAWLGARVYLTTVDRESELAGPLAIVCVNFVILKSVLSEEHNHSLIFLLLGMLVALWAREQGLYNPEDFVITATASSTRPTFQWIK
jgi:hypothetical protein